MNASFAVQIRRQRLRKFPSISYKKTMNIVLNLTENLMSKIDLFELKLNMLANGDECNLNYFITM